MQYRARINLLPLNNTLDFLHFVRDLKALKVLSKFVYKCQEPYFKYGDKFLTVPEFVDSFEKVALNEKPLFLRFNAYDVPKSFTVSGICDFVSVDD